MKIGILGGGQLARMLILSGIPLGFEFVVFDEKIHESTSFLANCHVGSFNDEETLRRFADSVDVITLEFENIPIELYKKLNEIRPCYPSPVALEISQDRLLEKECLRSLGIEIAPYSSIEDIDDLERFSKSHGFPFVVKTRRFGYDGKGQQWVKDEDDLPKISFTENTLYVAEKGLSFDRELSLIGVFGQNGEFQAYPLGENEHRNGILHKTVAPAPRLSSTLQDEAESITKRLGTRLGYRGVLVVEFFQCGETLVVNEFAPRVHNSGHYTIEGACTSQFENHIRAVAGLPLGASTLLGKSTMTNIVGEEVRAAELCQEAGLHLHSYGKSAAPGRKLGHYTKVMPFEDVERFYEKRGQ